MLARGCGGPIQTMEEKNMDRVQELIDAGRQDLRDYEARANAQLDAIRQQRESEPTGLGPVRSADWDPTQPHSDMPKP
jgi:hypothetical protein